jgi:hypothetical protein
MRPDGQTDMTKLIVALRNFAIAPKKGTLSLWIGTASRYDVIQKSSVMAALILNLTITEG